VTTRPPQPGTRAALPAWFALFLGLILTVGVAGPAGAQPTSEDADLRMVVSSLTGVLGPYSVPRTEDDPLAPPDPPLDLELRLLIENAGPEPLDSLRVVIELYPATATRADLTAAFEGSPAGQPKVHEVAVRDGGSLAPGDIAGVADVFPYDDVDVWSEDGGVHPLRIAVVRGTDVLAQTMSAVVWIASPIESPLLSTFVWPYDDAPWRTVRGAYVPDADRSIQPGGRLDTLLRTLERRPDAPVTLAPAAHLLEDLRDRADGFTVFERQADGSVERRELQPEDSQARLANDVLLRVREVAQQLPHAPVTGAYADADLVALTAVAQTQLAGEAAVEGRRRLQQLLDRAPDAGPTWSAVTSTRPSSTSSPGISCCSPPRPSTRAPPRAPAGTSGRSVPPPDGCSPASSRTDGSPRPSPPRRAAPARWPTRSGSSPRPLRRTSATAPSPIGRCCCSRPTRGRRTPSTSSGCSTP
jgi:hypothetical protein